MNHLLPKRWANSAVLVGLCSLLFLAPVANGEPGPEEHGNFKRERNFKSGPHGAGPHRLFKLLHKLDVSDDQRRAIGEIIDKHRPLMRQFFEEMHTRRSTLQTILTTGDYDENNMRKLASEQAASAEEMFIGTATTFREISAILNAEQRAQLAVLIDERRDRHHDRAERWRSHPKGHADGGEHQELSSSPPN
jgi:Spy/CpxP family protein refolding chaperone